LGRGGRIDDERVMGVAVVVVVAVEGGRRVVVVVVASSLACIAFIIGMEFEDFDIFLFGHSLLSIYPPIYER